MTLDEFVDAAARFARIRRQCGYTVDRQVGASLERGDDRVAELGDRLLLSGATGWQGNVTGVDVGLVFAQVVVVGDALEHLGERGGGHRWLCVVLMFRVMAAGVVVGAGFGGGIEPDRRTTRPPVGARQAAFGDMGQFVVQHLSAAPVVEGEFWPHDDVTDRG